MSCDDMKKCVDLIGNKALTEASGNVTIDTIYEDRQEVLPWLP